MEETTTSTGRTITNVGMLDLRYATGPEDLADIEEIAQVGLVLINEAASAAMGRIKLTNVGSVIPVPTGVQTQCMTGQVRLSGEALEAGDSETILLLAGQTIVTSIPQKVGFKEIRAYGIFLAPRGSEGAIGAKLTHMAGQNLYTPAGAKVLVGEELFTREYLEEIEPMSIVMIGRLTLAEDVTKVLLKEKIRDIVLVGELTTPEALFSVVRSLVSEKVGDISTTGKS